MGERRRKADGRRVFSTEFKRTTVQRILTGERTLAELSRELDISRRGVVPRPVATRAQLREGHRPACPARTSDPQRCRTIERRRPPTEPAFFPRARPESASHVYLQVPESQV